MKNDKYMMISLICGLQMNMTREKKVSKMGKPFALTYRSERTGKKRNGGRVEEADGR